MPSASPPAPGPSASAAPRGSGSTAWLERWFLRVALGVGAVAWVALLLAELGQLHLSLLAALVAAGIIGLAVQTRLGRPGRPPVPAGRVGVRGVAAFGAVTVLATALYFPAYDSFVFGDDASVYLSFGRKVAETGRLVFDDPHAASRRDPFPGEPRWQTIGMAGNVIVIVAHTEPARDRDAGEEVGRIISARRATKHERRAYEEGIC